MTNWLAPPNNMDLDPTVAHVWRIELDRPPVPVDTLRALLSPQEKARADRLIRPIYRKRFATSRGLLRVLLAKYTNIGAADLLIEEEELGKPYLARAQNERGLSFNVSHSEDRALLGVTVGNRLGVDIEMVKSSRDLRGLARRYFAAAEIETLEGCSEENRLSTFYTYWCRKEAFLKAKGSGLRFPLNQVDVSAPPSPHIEILEPGSGSGELTRWTIHDLRPYPNFAGAVCLDSQETVLRLWDWSSG